MSNGMHIHPIQQILTSRIDREQRLRQQGKVIWLTGLSGSGKSTIALQLEQQLWQAGFVARLLDGDNLRAGLNSDLGFSLADRAENIRRAAEVACLFLHSGIITINSFISPTHELRAMAKAIVGPADFIEVFVDTPLHICEARDVKGLYKKARAGEIPAFTGISDPYEVPEAPDIRVQTENTSVDEGVQQLMDFLLPRIQPQV
jgi:adenylylsulfate kinase